MRNKSLQDTSVKAGANSSKEGQGEGGEVKPASSIGYVLTKTGQGLGEASEVPRTHNVRRHLFSGSGKGLLTLCNLDASLAS